MNKLENMIDLAKLNELLGKKEEKKKSNVLLWVFAIIGVAAIVGGVVYTVYRYFGMDYMDEFDDEFDDDDDDDDDDFYEESEDSDY